MTNIDNEDSRGEPMQFTPGTWREYAPQILDNDDDGSYTKFSTDENYRYIVGGKEYFDEEAGKGGFMLSGYISLADARLMAAAKDLLEQLHGAANLITSVIRYGPSRISDLVRYDVFANELAQIEALIAKVEGRDVAEPSGESEVA